MKWITAHPYLTFFLALALISAIAGIVAGMRGSVSGGVK